MNNSTQPSSAKSRSILNVPLLTWDKCTTFGGALEAASAVTPHPMSYDTIMGTSALAFRVRWFHGEDGRLGDGSCAVGEVGESVAAAGKAGGWSLPAKWMPDTQERIAVLVSQIDQGLPVALYDAGWNVAVAVGYEDDGQTALVLSYDASAPKRESMAKLPPMLFPLGQYTQALSPRDALLAGMALAVEDWRRAPVPFHPRLDVRGNFLLGDEALRAWAEDVNKATALDAKLQGIFLHCNRWNFQTLVDARRAGLRYLKSSAPLLSGAGRAALDEAIAAYEKEVAIFDQASDGRGGYPWFQGSVAELTPEIRAQERAVLDQIRQLDGTAIAAFGRVLTAEGGGTSQPTSRP